MFEVYEKGAHKEELNNVEVNNVLDDVFAKMCGSRLVFT